MLKTDSIHFSRSSPVWNIDTAASVTLSAFDSPSPFSARHLRSCPSVKALSSPVLRKCSNSVIPDDSPAIPRLEPRADNAAKAAFGVSPTPAPVTWSGFTQSDLDFIAPCPVAQHAIKTLTVMRPGLVISGHTAHEVIVMWQVSDELHE